MVSRSSSSSTGPRRHDGPKLVALLRGVTARSNGGSWLGSWVVRREPVGVVAAITAYNFPFLLNVMKLGPALAAGNTVVLKPSPFTPLTAMVIAEAAAEAELPRGVVNIVTGDATVGHQLSTAPEVVTWSPSRGPTPSAPPLRPKRHRP